MPNTSNTLRNFNLALSTKNDIIKMQGLLLLLCSIFFIFILPFSTANNFVGEKENRKAIVWQIFRERYPKQVLCFVKVNTNGKLETRTKGIVDKCSDLTCTKKYALTEGPKQGGGGGVNVGHSLSPPSHFMLVTGLILSTLKRFCHFKKSLT